MQESLDLFPDNEDEAAGPSSPTSSQIMMHLSVAVVAGVTSTTPKTLTLTGDIQGVPLSILVDTGSFHTFPVWQWLIPCRVCISCLQPSQYKWRMVLCCSVILTFQLLFGQYRAILSPPM